MHNMQRIQPDINVRRRLEMSEMGHSDQKISGFRISLTSGELVRNDGFEVSWFDLQQSRVPAKKIAAGVPGIEHFRHRRRRFALLGVLLNVCLAVFQFLKFIVPGAFFAEDFGVALNFRAFGFVGL